MQSTSTPPPPPPKPTLQAPSRNSTPQPAQPPLPPHPQSTPFHPPPSASQPPTPQDPGPTWIPETLLHKSKSDLQSLLSNHELLTALAHSPAHAPPSHTAHLTTLSTALSENNSLAQHLLALQTHLQNSRQETQKQLLQTHALDRTWRAKEKEMDRALGAFSAGGLYQRLVAGVAEMDGVSRALEDTLEVGEGGMGGREVEGWCREYRENRRRGLMRGEGRGRWDEGRVGGWR